MPGRSHESLHSILKTISEFEYDKFNEIVFYRGHPDRSYVLAPSVFRLNGDLLPLEHQMYNEMLAANPADFRDDTSAFDRLARMQHYGLPTRILDITLNPLVALFFACKEAHSTGGQLLMFKTKISNVLPPTSDKVSVLSNLSRLRESQRVLLNPELPIAQFNVLDEAKKLVHFIRDEKPSFKPEIVPSDINKVLIVRAKMAHPRIYAQSGAFLLFGQGAKISVDDLPAEMTIRAINISRDRKKEIFSELTKVNISERTLFPEIEKSAVFLKNRYEEQARSVAATRVAAVPVAGAAPHPGPGPNA